MIKRILFIFLAICASSQFVGCLHVDKEAVGTLTELGKEDKGRKEEFEQQEKAFKRLKKAIQKKRMKVGRAGTSVAKHYGSPVIVFPEEGGERWLYKEKGRWFKAPKIYLYFDEGHHLKKWRCIRTECEKLPAHPKP